MFYIALISLHHSSNESNTEKFGSINIHSNCLFLLILASPITSMVTSIAFLHGIQRALNTNVMGARSLKPPFETWTEKLEKQWILLPKTLSGTPNTVLCPPSCLRLSKTCRWGDDPSGRSRNRGSPARRRSATSWLPSELADAIRSLSIAPTSPSLLDLCKSCLSCLSSPPVFNQCSLTSTLLINLLALFKL